MRFLADMGISPATVAFLVDLGHDAVHLHDQGLDRLALDHLHHDEQTLRLLVEVVDLGDRRVVDRARGLGLLEEARLPIGVLRELGGQDLEGHRAAELRVPGSVDHPHAALAELLLDLVVLEGLPDHRVGW